MSRPVAYQTIPVDFTVADRLEIRAKVGYFHLWEVTDAGGLPVLDARCEVRFGEGIQYAVPFTYNSMMEFTDRVNYIEVRWNAQAGRRGLFLISENPEALNAQNAPTRQLVTSAIGSGLTTANATVGTVSALLAPANTLRQSLVIQNRGAAEIFVGPSGVTTANGLGIAPGGSFVLDRTTAALHAISASAGNDVRLLTELS